MAEVGRNAQCPCGSGRKYKRCCLGKESGRASTGYTDEDRGRAFALVEHHMERPRWAAFLRKRFAEAIDGRGGIFELSSLDEYTRQSLGDAILDWICFEARDERGVRLVDDLLDSRKALAVGSARFLRAMANSCIRPWEVVRAQPGQTITFCDLVDDAEITVRERTASKTVMPGQLVFARIVTDTGELPQIERGLLPASSTARAQTAAACERWRTSSGSVTERSTELGLALIDIWIDGTLSGWLPQMVVGDGEAMMLTRSTFNILAPDQISATLDEVPGAVSQEEASWRWTAGPRTPPAFIRIEGARLVLETVSVEQDLAARAMLEAALGAAIRHRSTTHEHPAQALAAVGEQPKEKPESGLPRGLERRIILQHLHGHYFAWLDEGVPALDGATPRDAAGVAALMPKLKSLLRGLDKQYLDGLMNDDVAPFDPSWMWAALGVPRVAQPALTLGHEVVADHLDGFADICQTIVARRHAAADFGPTNVILNEELATDIGTRALLIETARRVLPADAPKADAADWSALVATHLGYAVNHALHGRETFEIEESLSYLLANTDLDVQGAQLGLPSPGAALVFRDRDMLALMEQTLAMNPTCEHRGTFLQTLTVYVSGWAVEDYTVLRLTCVCDAADGRLPHLLVTNLRYGPNDHLEGTLVRHLEVLDLDDIDTFATESPWRAALRTVLNTLLYINSPKSPREARTRAACESPEGTAPALSALDVVFLPGALDMDTVRGLRHLEFSHDGRTLKDRFLSRGRWRRANSSWKDQRPRWITPKWSGPSVDTVVERLYGAGTAGAPKGR